MDFIRGVYKESESFKMFTKNSGLSAGDMDYINLELKETGEVSDVTTKFLRVLSDNKRLDFIDEIASKFMNQYRVLNKEEKITIISAEELDEGEKSEVHAALS